MKRYDIIIIGGGASGIMAAIVAAKSGSDVLLLEKNPLIGRKILATGNGRCNITNTNINVRNYYGSNKTLIQKILGKFNQNDTLKFFENLGLIFKEEENGRIFPRTNQASSVVSALEYELRRLNIHVLTSEEASNITKDDIFKIKTKSGKDFEATKLILATGGKAAHQLGSNGDGIFWAKKFGHNIIPIYPALVPVETIESWVKQIQGLKINAKVDFLIAGEKISSKTGDLLFTHFGLSGPTILGQARFVAPYIQKETIEIDIDCYPEGDNKKLDETIQRIIHFNGAKLLKNCLSGLVPLSLIMVILKNCEIDGEKKAAQISKYERAKIVKELKKMTLHAKSLRPFKEAQVSMGGVDLNEVSDNLESKIVTGLYFCGEVMDVDADSGGFNLQWAWSSGFAAGSNAALKKQ